MVLSDIFITTESVCATKNWEEAKKQSRNTILGKDIVKFLYLKLILAGETKQFYFFPHSKITDKGFPEMGCKTSVTLSCLNPDLSNNDNQSSIVLKYH